VGTLVGTQGMYATDSVASYLKDLIVSRLADRLGSLKIGLLDLPSKYDDVATDTRSKLLDEFAKYGLELVDFFINAITPPEEVQKAIDARSSMGAVGDLNSFMKFQAANSMAKLAEQGGGGADGAMGMGFGAGFGMMMPGMMQQAMTGGPRTSPAGAAAAGAAVGPDLSQIAPSVADPKSAVRAVATAAGYAVAELGAMLQITVPVGPLRKQTVNVEFPQGSINYWSVCGPYDEKAAADLLRFNAAAMHGALAVRKVGEVEMVVLQANQASETITPIEISRTLSALAWQADQMEQKILGGDQN
jgi:hypothetical protein